jgi:hypothetical protein
MRSLILYQRLRNVIRHKSPHVGAAFAWDMLGIYFFEGTTLHGYGESLFNKWGMQAPDLAKTRFVEDLHKELTSKYVGENRASSILSSLEWRDRWIY